MNLEPPQHIRHLDSGASPVVRCGYRKDGYRRQPTQPTQKASAIMATKTPTKTPTKTTESEAPKPKAKDPKPCQCGLTIDPATNQLRPGVCQATTKKQFAQGHDARRKSWLLRQYRQEGSVEALNELIERGWAKSKEDAAPRKRTPKRAAPKEVKVGRHTFPVVSIEGDVVTYKTAKGEKTTSVANLVTAASAA